MAFSLPKNLHIAARQVPYSLLTVLTVGVTFAMLVRILQFVLPVLPVLPFLASSMLSPASPQSGMPFLPSDVDSRWHAPASTEINDHSRALDGSGPMAKKFVPKSDAGASGQPEGWEYGVYNYCNMPHVRKQEYVRKDSAQWELMSVEVIQRRECSICNSCWRSHHGLRVVMARVYGRTLHSINILTSRSH